MDIFEFMNEFFAEDANFSDEIGQEWRADAKVYTKQKHIDKDGAIVEIYERVVTNDPKLQAEMEKHTEFTAKKITDNVKLPHPIPENS